MPSPSSQNPTKPSLLILLVLLSFLFYYYHTLHTNPHPSSPRNPQNTPNHYRNLFIHPSLSSTSASTISAHLRRLTLHPHLAGTPSAAPTAQYVLRHLDLPGIETLVKPYQPLLSYPAHASLALHLPNGTVRSLPLSEHPTADAVFPAYHAYSPSGDAFAEAVYVNQGREEDYERLEELGVRIRGKVVVVRRGGGPRGRVVEAAAERGAEAVVMFTEETVRAGVERGTVMMGLGDPLTPGWAARVGDERLRLEDEEVKERFPRIPSMPVSVDTAEVILRELRGPEVPEEWWGPQLRIGGGRVGSGPVILNFTYREDRKMATIQNVFGVIRGQEEPDRYVILGNHRDAWTYGAVDPNSGTAVLLEIAKRLSVLMQSGWKPRRTIVLCSWDAEEFGMIGSTEWVEENLVSLGSNAVAYLNVDCAVQGPGFFASATPQLDSLLVDVTKKVKDPDSEGMTVYQTWVSKSGGISIERLGRADSDFSAFLHHAGIPSIDLYYGEAFPVYHTAFDSYEWMKVHGDPLFRRHVAVADIWGLLALHLADDPVLPFNHLSYVAQLREHTSILSTLLKMGVSLQPLNNSIQELASAANEVEHEKKELQDHKNTEDSVELKRSSLNDRLMLGERGLLDAEGLKGRSWFKHLSREA
ncbi:putative glutamate carboxypeptidase 2 [Acorus calamus]|uniref:glutamate carboxypeptidase II n=1 Tax=Acorus calamus TaxID=4465 RepID=A0AAV9CG57_ACOCL|nr:putative glutamate carboxypeptidase 2 [Acorus calamus]